MMTTGTLNSYSSASWREVSLGTVRSIWQSEGLLIAVLGLQIAIVLFLHAGYPDVVPIDSISALIGTLSFIGVVVPICLVWFCFYRVIKARPPGSAIVALRHEIWRYISDRQRLSNGLPVTLLFIPFVTLFTHFKINIPVIQTFSWDETLTTWDRTLFFGRLPYEIFSPIMSHTLVLFLTNAAYNLWFFLMLGTMLACAFMRERSEMRTRYLVAFFLVWLIEGNLLAVALSSAGPCFYGALGFLQNPYQPLMDTLREANSVLPIYALPTQQMLWSGYIGEAAPGGISAMPSLHNALAILMALAARQFGRRIRLCFTAYAIWIFVGSISLAWHYAVDGLVALPVTVALWAFSGYLARWWHKAPLGRKGGSYDLQQAA